MDYMEFRLWKAGVLVFLAFCWGLWRGFIGLPLERARRDSQTEETQKDRLPER